MTTAEIEPMKRLGRCDLAVDTETKKYSDRVVVTRTITSYHECPHCKKGIKAKVVTVLTISENDFLKK